MLADKSKQLKGKKNHKEKNKLKTATTLKINAQGEKEVQVKNNDSISLKAYLTWSREHKGGEMLHVASICYYWVSRMRASIYCSCYVLVVDVTSQPFCWCESSKN